jgi:hypothetical protein
MTIDYYYYIAKEPNYNEIQKKSDIPVVSKIRKDTFHVGFELTNFLQESHQVQTRFIASH